MKKYLIILVGMIVLNKLSAQDFVLLRTGEEIWCKVEMVGNGLLTYRAEKSKSNKISLPINQVYMIKYEKRGNTFYNFKGEVIKTSPSASQLSKKDIGIYLCEGEEIIASEVSMDVENVSYKISGKNNLISKKRKGESFRIPKSKIFLIRYYDGTKELLTNLEKQENEYLVENIQDIPVVNHPFIPTSKDTKYPCPATLRLENRNELQVIIYDEDNQYVHYRKKDWQDGPIFRMSKKKVKKISFKQ